MHFNFDEISETPKSRQLKFEAGYILRNEGFIYQTTAIALKQLNKK